MNKQIRPTVYKILKEDKLAREDDNYLILQTVCQLLPYGSGTAFVNILTGMKHKGISFEAITRARRKFFEENPQYKEQVVERARRKKEEEYFLEYSRHIPRIN